MHVVVAQGAADVGLKRKADEDNQIYDWQQDERAYEVQVKQWQRNNDVRTKMIAGAEAAVVKAKGVAEAAGMKAKGLAEAKGMFEIKKAEAFVMRTDANANAIKIEADANKIGAEANKIGAEAEIKKAEAEKIKAETALLQFELEQKKNAAGIAPVVPVAMLKKGKSVAPANAPMVPLAIYNRSTKTKPLTEEQKLNKRNKAQQVRLDAKAYRDGLGSA